MSDLFNPRSLTSVQADQLAAGRALAAAERGIVVKPSYTAPRSERPAPRPKPAGGRSDINGHEKYLFKLAQEKAEIVVELMSGTIVQGHMVFADKFTITVRVNGIDRLYFKHALECVRTVEQKAMLNG